MKPPFETLSRTPGLAGRLNSSSMGRPPSSPLTTGFAPAAFDALDLGVRRPVLPAGSGWWHWPFVSVTRACPHSTERRRVSPARRQPGFREPAPVAQHARAHSTGRRAGPCTVRPNRSMPRTMHGPIPPAADRSMHRPAKPVHAAYDARSHSTGRPDRCMHLPTGLLHDANYARSPSSGRCLSSRGPAPDSGDPESGSNPSHGFELIKLVVASTPPAENPHR